MPSNKDRKNNRVGNMDVRDITYKLIEESPGNWEDLSSRVLARLLEGLTKEAAIDEMKTIDFGVVDANLEWLAYCGVVMDVTEPGIGSTLMTFLDLMAAPENVDTMKGAPTDRREDVMRIVDVVDRLKAYLISKGIAA